MVETAKIFELQTNKSQKTVKKSIIQELPALNRKRRIKIQAQRSHYKEYFLFLFTFTANLGIHYQTN